MRSDLILRAWYASRSQISVPYMTSLFVAALPLGRTVSGYSVRMQQMAIVLCCHSHEDINTTLSQVETESCACVRYYVAVIGGIYVNIRKANVETKGTERKVYMSMGGLI